MQTPSSNPANEKTLFDVLSDVWQAKIYMLCFGALALVLAFCFTVFARDYYRTEMLVAPAVLMGQGLHQSSSSSEGSIQVQPEEMQSAAAFLRFEQIYDGVSVASLLINDQDFINAVSQDLPFEFSSSLGQSWNPEKLADYLNKHVFLEPVSGTPLRKITYYHPDPETAKMVVAKVHRVADEIIRARLLREVMGRIGYLNTALSQTNNPEHRRNLAELLMQQEQIKMMVSLDEPFAASIVEPPYVSANPRWPDPFLIYPLFLIIGLMTGFVVFGMRKHG